MSFSNSIATLPKRSVLSSKLERTRYTLMSETMDLVAAMPVVYVWRDNGNGSVMFCVFVKSDLQQHQLVSLNTCSDTDSSSTTSSSDLCLDAYSATLSSTSIPAYIYDENESEVYDLAEFVYDTTREGYCNPDKVSVLMKTSSFLTTPTEDMFTMDVYYQINKEIHEEALDDDEDQLLISSHSSETHTLTALDSALIDAVTDDVIVMAIGSSHGEYSQVPAASVTMNYNVHERMWYSGTIGARSADSIMYSTPFSLVSFSQYSIALSKPVIMAGSARYVVTAMGYDDIVLSEISSTWDMDEDNFLGVLTFSGHVVKTSRDSDLENLRVYAANSNSSFTDTETTSAHTAFIGEYIPFLGHALVDGDILQLNKIYRPSQSVINDIYITNHSALTEEIVVYTEAKGNVTVNYITLDIPMDCVEYASMDEVENNGQLIVAETDICEALFIIAHNIPSSVLST
ncbi:hypothetical protein ADUPG1_000570, partial [Aduncisulcus paluster]